MSKIAILSSYTVTPHFETELEIIKNHLDAGDYVYQIECNKDWNVCLSNPKNEVYVCNQCVAKRLRAYYLLNKKFTRLSLFKNKKYNLSYIKTSFNSIEELRLYKIDNFDIGMAVLSTLISYARSPYIKVEDYQDYIKRSIEAAAITYFALRDYLATHKFERFYIFNGRFSIERAAMRACEYHNQPFYIHERGCDMNHYEIFHQSLPHSISYTTKQINDYWEKHDDIDLKCKRAHEFFNSRLNNISKSWTTFLDLQKYGLLPDSWDKSQYNIVIFTSSENEYVAIGDEWKQTIFDSQISGIKELYDLLKEYMINDNIRVYIRMHPNLVNYKPEYEYVASALSSLKDYFYIIEPESEISSYSLLLACDKVLTFGSSMGFEATYYGKPSILLSSSFYMYMDVAYLPRTKKEALDLILDRHLQPKSKLNAIKIGYYMESFGIKYKYYKPNSLFSGTFEGNWIHGSNENLDKYHLFKQSIKILVNKFIRKNIFRIYV